MINNKKFAISLLALAAIAIPASALDDRRYDHKPRHVNSFLGIDLNLGALRISNNDRGYRHKRYQQPRVFVALANDRRYKNYELSRFQEIVRSRFAKASRGDFQLVSSPRHADIVIRLERDKWGKAYRKYMKASRKGQYSDHFGRRAKMIDRVTDRLLYRAHDIYKKSYRNARYDRDDRRRRDDRYSSRRDDRYYSHRNDRRNNDY